MPECKLAPDAITTSRSSAAEGRRERGLLRFGMALAALAAGQQAWAADCLEIEAANVDLVGSVSRDRKRKQDQAELNAEVISQMRAVIGLQRALRGRLTLHMQVHPQDGQHPPGPGPNAVGPLGRGPRQHRVLGREPAALDALLAHPGKPAIPVRDHFVVAVGTVLVLLFYI